MGIASMLAPASAAVKSIAVPYAEPFQDGATPVPEWLLISYSVPTQPSAVRVASWRALKGLGALNLGDGLYALPNGHQHVEALQKVATRIEEGGGTALVFTADALTPTGEANLRDRFCAERTDEYLQSAKSARRLVEHIGREEATDDYRFAEVDSLEEELEKVRRQFDRAVARDHLGAPAKEEAQAALLEAETALRVYLNMAYRKDSKR